MMSFLPGILLLIWLMSQVSNTTLNCTGVGNDNDNHTRPSNGTRATPGLSFYDVEYIADVIIDVLPYLKITVLCIFSDRKSDPLVNALLERLSDPPLHVLIYTVEHTDTDTLLESYVTSMGLRTDNTFSMVLCGDFQNTIRTFRSVVGGAWTNYREGYNESEGTQSQGRGKGQQARPRMLGRALGVRRQTGIEHNTRWLVALMTDEYLDQLEREVVMLDNVAVVVPLDCGSPMARCARLGVYTLQINVDLSKRHLAVIGMASEDCDVYLNDTLYPNRNGGFNGRHFNIGLYVWEPFTMRINKSDEISYEGFCVDLVQELSVRLNFKYTLTEPADNNWGSPLPDGNWTGLVGMLQRNEIDVSVAAIIITEEREAVMDGTFPFYYDHVGVLYKRLDPQDSMWKTYLYPFKPEVFMWIGASVLFSCTAYLVLSLLSPYFTTVGTYSHRPVVTYLDGMACAASRMDNVFSAVFQQGRPEAPMHCSGQVFLAFWWLFLMIVAAIYKGNLIAFLMVPQEDIPFKTLYDLATQDVYRWGVTGSTVVEYLFTVSQRPDFRLLGIGIEAFKADDKDINSLDPLVHLAKVKAGQYAYISDMVPMEIWMSEDCDLRLLEQTVIPLPFVVGLHNNSAFLSLFNKQLLDIDQMGLYSVWKQRWWPEMGHCGRDSRTAKKVLSVVETQSSFYILCLGTILSLLCLVLEYFMKTRVFASISSTVHNSYVWIKNEFVVCRRQHSPTNMLVME